MPQDENDSNDETRRVTRTDTGVTISTKVQRGTGTNDRDTIEAKVKAETREEALADLEALRGPLREYIGVVRGWQPAHEDR